MGKKPSHLSLDRFDEYNIESIMEAPYAVFASTWVGLIATEAFEGGFVSVGCLVRSLNQVKARYDATIDGGEIERHRKEYERKCGKHRHNIRLMYAAEHLATRKRRLAWCYEERVRRAEAKSQAEVERLCRESMVCDLERQDQLEGAGANQ